MNPTNLFSFNRSRKYSLYETYEDEFGNLDFQRSQHGTGMSKGGEAKKFVAELQALAERTFNNLFTTQQLYQLAKDMQLRVTNFEDFVDSLNNQGYLLKKGNQVYKLLTSSLN
jgi:DNA helicase MCM8